MRYEIWVIGNAITAKPKTKVLFFNDILTRKSDTHNTRVKSIVIDYPKSYSSSGHDGSLDQDLPL